MNDMERRLIELNDKLLELASRNVNTKEEIDEYLRALNMRHTPTTISSQPNADIINVNVFNDDDQPDCGSTGYTGSQGDIGYTGSQGDIGYTGSCSECECDACDIPSCITVHDDYDITQTDCYIGVESEEPITLTLPSGAADGKCVIIKLQMGPPIGNKKVTVLSEDACYIDGNTSVDLKLPYESMQLVKNDNQWNIISVYY
jgi:hypothetical protein